MTGSDIENTLTNPFRSLIQQNCKIQNQTQKSCVFLGTSNEQPKQKIKKTIPPRKLRKQFHLESQQKEYFVINKTKKVQ